MVRNNPVFGSFNQGDVPTIACFSRATVDMGMNFDKLIAALQVYVDKHVFPVWGTPAKLVKSKGFVKNQWALVFLDDADQPGALAYHDLTPSGLPLSKVFVKTTQEHGEPVSVAASHELVEMLVDPAVNIMTTGPDLKAVYAYESADPVEALSFKVNGIPMSNFVYPSYFETFHKPKSVQFDHMKAVTRPFQILKGGYQVIFRNGRWSQVHGSKMKAQHFRKEDRRGHRSETRKAGMLRKTSSAVIAKRKT